MGKTHQGEWGDDVMQVAAAAAAAAGGSYRTTSFNFLQGRDGNTSEAYSSRVCAAAV